MIMEHTMLNRSGLLWVLKVKIIALRMTVAVVLHSCLYIYMSIYMHVDMHPLSEKRMLIFSLLSFFIYYFLIEMQLRYNICYRCTT